MSECLIFYHSKEKNKPLDIKGLFWIEKDNDYNSDIYFSLRDIYSLSSIIPRSSNSLIFLSFSNVSSSISVTKLFPSAGGTDGSHLAFKGIATPNLFKGSENSHGPYEFVTVERMKLASDVIMTIIGLVQEKQVIYNI